MKKISSLAIILFTSLSIYCQTPELMSYQAVVRNAESELLTEQTVGMKISILEDTASGTPVYVETQYPITNTNGLLSLQVGAGTVVSGDITTIDWANHDYFIRTETDPTGGQNYTITGTSQILSVPYALLSKTAVNVINDLVDDADNDPSNEYNTEIELNGSILSIVDGGGIQNTDLSSLQGQGPQGETGPKEYKVKLVRQEQQAHRVHKASKEYKVIKESKARKELKVNKEKQDHKVFKAQLVLLV